MQTMTQYREKDAPLFEAVHKLQEGDAGSTNNIYNFSEEYIRKLVCDVIKDAGAAEKLLSEIYMEIYNRIDMLREPEEFYKWAGRIATEQVFGYLRKNRRDALVTTADEKKDVNFRFETASEDREKLFPEYVMADEEFAYRISEIVKGFSIREKLTMQFYYYEELSIGEIAVITGYPEQVIKNHLYHIRGEIHRMVKELFTQNRTVAAAGLNTGQKKSFYSLSEMPVLLLVFREELEGRVKKPTVPHAAQGNAEENQKMPEEKAKTEIQKAAENTGNIVSGRGQSEKRFTAHALIVEGVILIAVFIIIFAMYPRMIEKKEEKNNREAVEKWEKSADSKAAEGDYQGAYTDYMQVLNVDRENVNALYRVGELYYNGTGVAQNYGMAYLYYKEAYNNGYKYAAGRLGDMFYDGIFLKQDYAQAFEMYQSACEYSEEDAWRQRLGLCYMYGSGTEQNKKKAFEYLSDTVSEKLPEGAGELAKLYLYGEGTAQDDKKAKEYFIIAAQNGDAESMGILGGIYLAQEKYEHALKWCEKGAAAGDAYAMYCLGNMYRAGVGVEVDRDAALEWYEKAVALDNVDAMYELGCLYDSGEIVKKDYEKAAGLFLKSAQMGKESAMPEIGKMYYQGRGIEKDDKEAKFWLETAKKAGFDIGEEGEKILKALQG